MAKFIELKQQDDSTLINTSAIRAVKVGTASTTFVYFNPNYGMGAVSMEITETYESFKKRLLGLN